MALVVQELATNSLKYGALSIETGTLDISGSMVGEDVQIVWTEQGGPEAAEPQNLCGYGSNLVQRTMKDHLRGSVTYDWSQGGTVVTMLISGNGFPPETLH